MDIENENLDELLQNENPLLIPPDEYDRLTKSKNVKRLNPSTIEIKNISDNNIPEGKYRNLGNKLSIDLETNGRFSIPKKVYFNDYTTEDVNALITSREEDIYETLISILERCKDEDATGQSFSIGEMTINEFFELLIGMKSQFDTPLHIHRWICSCQDEYQDSLKTPSEIEINLNELTYKSIEQADEEIQEMYRDYILNLSEDSYNQFLLQRFEDKFEEFRHLSREDIIKDIIIKEPLSIYDNGKIYKFKFIRVKNSVEAYRKVCSEIDPKIRLERNKQYHGMSREEINAKKEEIIQNLKLDKARKALLYAQAISLESVDDRQLKTFSDKLGEYKKLSRSGMMDFLRMADLCLTGVNTEFDQVCNLCGKTERGFLQRKINPIELLPLSSDSESSTKRKLSKSSGINIFFPH